MKPHSCPVCGASGRVIDQRSTATAVNIITCPACRGTCIVWEPEQFTDSDQRDVEAEVASISASLEEIEAGLPEGTDWEGWADCVRRGLGLAPKGPVRCMASLGLGFMEAELVGRDAPTPGPTDA